MAENTKIEWADATWNPWWGCTKVSVGDKGACEFCYAEETDARFHLPKGEQPRVAPHWGPHAPRKRAGPGHLAQPHQWQRKARRDGTRPFVFCASMADIFDNQVDPSWRREAFDTMRACPDLVWLLLTKRPSMIEKLSAEAGGLPPNAALGASIVTQEEADRDLPHLLVAKHKLRALFAFASMEPLMGAVDLRRVSTMQFRGAEVLDALTGELAGMFGDPAGEAPALDWVIAGGESGPKARPSHPDWFRSLRDQCAAAGVPFLFKQWGEWAPVRSRDIPVAKLQHVITGDEAALDSIPWVEAMEKLGKKAAGRFLDGVEHNGFPPGFGKDERAAA